MYRQHFALTDFPFPGTALPDQLFASKSGRETEARLQHLIELRGIGLLTGEAGCGRECQINRVSGKMFQLQQGGTPMKQIPDELLEQLLEDYEKPEDVLGSEGLLASLQKAVMERALEAELAAHLGYARHDPAGRGSGNSRNGHGSKTVLTDRSEVELNVPRDRNGSFEPQLVKKRQTRLPGFDEQVIALYARGLSPAILRMGELAGVGWDRRAFGRAVERQLRGDQGGWERRPGGPGCMARAVACSRALPGAPPPLGSGRARRWPDGWPVAS